MKVVNLSSTDYANYGYHNAQALKAVGVDAESYCIKSHGFNYKAQSTLISRQKIRKIIKDADVVQVMHSKKELYYYLQDYKGKIVVWHTGTRYRFEHHELNRFWERYADKAICALPEFMYIAPFGSEYFGITYQDNKTNKPATNEKLTVGHYPSNRTVKGSDTIDKILRKFEGIDYKTGGLVSNAEHLERYNGLDVYIEMMNLKQMNKPYGSYGTTAIEAASKGCIVITNDINKEVYSNHYGKTALRICNSKEEIEAELNRLLNLPLIELIQLKVDTYQWYLDNHSYIAQGNRLKQILTKL